MNDLDHELAVAREELMQLVPLKGASQALLAEVRGLRALEATDGVRRPELRVVQGTGWAPEPLTGNGPAAARRRR
jgi:hypothetical protein